MNKPLKGIISTLFLLFFFTGNAHAHVVVKPPEVVIGAFQTFTIGVPNEKDNPTIALRLVLPEGLKYVSPNVKPGWRIDFKKLGEGENSSVSEISWTGGAIPTGQRDEFLFSAKVPDTAGTLKWKAYQTYQDGTIVSWDQEPNQSNEKSTPFSKTEVMNDMQQSTIKERANEAESHISSYSLEHILPYIAVALSIVSLGISLKRKK